VGFSFWRWFAIRTDALHNFLLTYLLTNGCFRCRCMKTGDLESSAKAVWQAVATRDNNTGTGSRHVLNCINNSHCRWRDWYRYRMNLSIIIHIECIHADSLQRTGLNRSNATTSVDWLLAPRRYSVYVTIILSKVQSWTVLYMLFCFYGPRKHNVFVLFVYASVGPEQ